MKKKETKEKMKEEDNEFFHRTKKFATKTALN